MKGSTGKYPLGILVVVGLVLCHKSYQLAVATAPDSITDCGLSLFRADGEVLGLVALFALVTSLTPLTIARYALHLFLFCFSLLVIVDTQILLALDIHLILGEVLKYLPDIDKVLTFVSYSTVVSLLIAVGISLVWIELSLARAVLIVSISAVLLLCSILPSGVTFERVVSTYSLKPFLVDLTKSVAFLADAEATGTAQAISHPAALVQVAAQEYKQRATVSVPSSSPNIILLEIESLSAVDLKSFGGIADRLPVLDRIGAQGKIFTNFLANYGDTAGALVSLTMAMEPVPYPGMSTNLHQAYANPNSVVNSFRNRGYHTEFLTNSDLDFLGQGTFCKVVGYDACIGMREDSQMFEAPVSAFHCPADQYLYEAFERRWDEIKTSEQPKFFTMFTISSHQPYQDRLGNPTSPDEVWTYVDQQIGRFYNYLKRINYFDNGLLIISGDHHKMQPLTEAEFASYKMRAAARVPLIIVGKGVVPGQVDSRLWSQVDLFPQLSRAIESDASLADEVLHIDYESVRVFESQGQVRANLWVFTSEGEYEAELENLTVNWPGRRPAHADRIVARVQKIQAARQAKDERVRYCHFDAPQMLRTSFRPGLDVKRIKGKDISHPLDSKRKEFGHFVVSNVDFPDYDSWPMGVPDDTSFYFTGYVFVEKSGDYKIRATGDDGVCLGVDGSPLIEANYSGLVSDVRSIYLEKGFHFIEARYYQEWGDAIFTVEWMPPGGKEGWVTIDPGLWRRAALAGQGSNVTNIS